MNKKVKVLVAALLLPLGVIVPYLSLESQYAAPISAQSQDAGQAQRIIGYKATMTGVAPTKSDLDRMKLRCNVAQAHTKILLPTVETVQKNRVAGYDNISTRLGNLLVRLNKQAYETTALTESTNILNAKIADYKTTMNAYTQSIDDLTNMKCTDDPLAFLAGLQASRRYHERLVTMVGDIRVYINNTIKPNLQQIRLQIDTGSTTGETKQ